MRTKKTETALHNTMPRRYAGEHECSESTDPGVDGSVYLPFTCFQGFFFSFLLHLFCFVCLFFLFCVVLFCFLLFFFCSRLSVTTITT